MDLSNAYLANRLFSVRMNRMAKKSDKAEIDWRIHAVVKLLSSTKTSSYVCRYARDEWGVGQATAERYMKRARGIIRDDYSVERSDFLGTRLALLDEIIEASIRYNQHSNAVGALKLQAQLTRLLEGG